jgi:hypothetical protein
MTLASDALVDVARRTAGPDLDAATEQLYDELFARVAAITEIVPRSLIASGPATGPELARVATRSVSSLRAGHGCDAAGQLIRLLWPTNTAPHAGHAWWFTPLRVILAESSQHTSRGEPCRDDGEN